MNQIIIALSGRKGSGKNTLSTSIRRWYHSDFCKKTGCNWGRDEITFECSFADNLKQFCIDTLGLRPEQCYGSDEEKNQPTQYDWNNAPKFLQWKFDDPFAKKMVEEGKTQDELMNAYFMRKYSHMISHPPSQHALSFQDGYMTGREIMQLFGTDLIRQTFGNVWADATIRSIKRMGRPMSIITDNRFPNEVESVLKQPGGYIIRLTRSPFGTEDVHPSESALDGYDWNRDKCFVLNNVDMTIQQQNDAVIPILEEITKES